MAVTIFDALQNADYNLQNNGAIGLVLAKQQLHNAVTLLEKRYPLETLVEPLLEKYGDVELVPERVLTYCPCHLPEVHGHLNKNCPQNPENKK